MTKFRSSMASASVDSWHNSNPLSEDTLPSSVGDPDPEPDPDPQDPHVFGPEPGSGSISQRCGSGSGSFLFLINVLSELK
jgi:hypothetical protein